MGRKYIVTVDTGSGQMEQRTCFEWSEVAKLILSNDKYMHILLTYTEGVNSEP